MLDADGSCVDVTQIKKGQDPKNLLSPAFVRVPRLSLRRATPTSSRLVAILFPATIRHTPSRRRRTLVALHIDFDRLGPAVRLAPAGVSDQ
jgi:hypothetical protein